VNVPAGSYVSGNPNNCEPTLCPVGYYQNYNYTIPWGEPLYCILCPDIYLNAGPGLAAESQCGFQTDPGYYIASAKASYQNTCPPGYYCPSGLITFGNTGNIIGCPAGLTTPGGDLGADEAGDCGKILHFGNDMVYLRSVKKTSPSLNMSIGGAIFYGNMDESSKGSLRVSYGGKTYAVFDDSM
jgi:hypothetical protein